VRAAVRARIARIVTISKAGLPQIMPLWFIERRGRLYMTNAVTSPTVRNIASNPGVLVLLEAPGGALLELRGVARYLTGKDALAPVVRASIGKYYLAPRVLWLYLRNLRRISTMLQYYRERSDSGVIEVTPESFQWIERSSASG